MAYSCAAASKILQFSARNEGNFGACEGLDVVIRNVEKEALKVQCLARNMDGDNLARPVPSELLAVCGA